MTSTEFRTKKREQNEAFSKVVDKHFDGLYEIAEALKTYEITGTRIETPFGDFVITPKLIYEKGL